MWWIALAKAVNNLQSGMRDQDMKRKQTAYNTASSLPIDNKAVQFGLNPDKNKPIRLQAPMENLDGEDESSYF